MSNYRLAIATSLLAALLLGSPVRGNAIEIQNKCKHAISAKISGQAPGVVVFEDWKNIAPGHHKNP